MADLKRFYSAPVQATTDAWADLGDVWNKSGALHGTLVLRNEGGANSADIQVLGSLDGVTFDIPVLASEALAANGVKVIELSAYYPFVKAQIKATVAAAQTNVSAQGASIPF